MSVRETFPRIERGGGAHETGSHPVGTGLRLISPNASYETGFTVPNLPGEEGVAGYVYYKQDFVWPHSDEYFITMGPREFRGSQDYWEYVNTRPAWGATLWRYSDGNIVPIAHEQCVDINLASANGSYSYSTRCGDNQYCMMVDSTFNAGSTWGGRMCLITVDPENGTLSSQVIGVDASENDDQGLGVPYERYLLNGQLLPNGWNSGKVTYVYPNNPASAFAPRGRWITFIEIDFNTNTVTRDWWDVREEFGPYANVNFTDVACNEDEIFVVGWKRAYDETYDPGTGTGGSHGIYRMRFNRDHGFLGATLLKTLQAGGGAWSLPMKSNTGANHGVLYPEVAQEIAGPTYVAGYVNPDGAITKVFGSNGQSDGSYYFLRWWQATHQADQILDFLYTWYPQTSTWNYAPSVWEGEPYVSTGGYRPFIIIDLDTGETVDTIYHNGTQDRYGLDIPPVRLSDDFFMRIDMEFENDIPDDDTNHLFWVGTRYFHLWKLTPGAPTRATSTHQASDRTIVRRYE